MVAIRYEFLIVIAFFCVVDAATRFGDNSFTFSNLVCKPLNKSIAEIEYCRIRSIKRYLKQFSLKIHLGKLPINHFQLGLRLMHKTNVYHPFLYNMVLDVCKYMKRPNNPLLKIYFCFLEGFTNINHTCPYNHPIIVTNLTNTRVNKCIEKLPFPKGEYAMITTLIANNKTAAEVALYLISEDLH